MSEQSPRAAISVPGDLVDAVKPHTDADGTTVASWIRHAARQEADRRTGFTVSDPRDRRIALLEAQLADTTIANAELRSALIELYEPNHRKHPNANRCDVCGMRWPCAHYDAALLIHGDTVE